MKIMTKIGTRVVRIVRGAFRHYGQSGGDNKAAAVAFYTLLSSAPLAYLGLLVASWLMSQKQAEVELRAFLVRTHGSQIAERIVDSASSIDAFSGTTFTTTISVIILVISSNRLISSLRQATRSFWRLPKRKSHHWAFRVARAILFSPLAGITAGILIVGNFFVDVFLNQAFAWVSPLLVTTLKQLLLFGLLTSMVYALFRVASEGVTERVLWAGSGMTSLLLVAVASLATAYLQSADLSSAFGSGGAGFVMLLWAYYTAGAFFFGASITFVALIKPQISSDAAPSPPGSSASLTSGSKSTERDS